ncbi:DgyrCDS5903 [Dimorphilus gyrociliatus]|uniref:DgyrCDS5903 n=1 Tax=Dimorphilus gyrociliatus TaxID=2664684 RepID=A0A7I8VLC5_9ANNE|nr:DgyrCDS5903 [Dimorphilus gyrociliatus]
MKGVYPLQNYRIEVLHRNNLVAFDKNTLPLSFNPHQSKDSLSNLYEPYSYGEDGFVSWLPKTERYQDEFSLEFGHFKNDVQTVYTKTKGAGILVKIFGPERNHMVAAFRLKIEDCADGFNSTLCQCSPNCSPIKLTDSCDIYSKACLEGCKSGYLTPSCNRTCDPGSWGLECKKSCKDHKCAEGKICYPDNGQCPNELCQPGYVGVYCKQPASDIVCQPNYWGSACLNKCGHCDGEAICDSKSGYCPGNRCAVGFQGPYCNQTCLIGYYGPNCEYECKSVCRYGCDSSTGLCKVDEKRSKLNDSQSTCRQGFWGKTCETRCHPYCKKCNSKTGKCQACTHQRWGKNCNKICKLTCICNQKTGTCEKCKRGYFGLACEYKCAANCKFKTCSKHSGYCITIPATTTAESVYYPKENAAILDCKGKWGIDCSRKCGHCDGNKPCDNDSGKCLNGCKTGFKGQLCNERCSDGYFGKDCQQNCGRCLPNTCSIFDGKCLGKCWTGFAGDYCNVSQEICGHCLGEGSCSTKQCSNNCQPGWKGRFCRTPCSIGSYGINCELACGYCSNISSCNRFTGKCETGCSQGYYGEFCFDKCPIGKYGKDCQNICGKCAYSACDHRTGNCPAGCKRGYRKPYCKESLLFLKSKLLGAKDKEEYFVIANKTAFLLVGTLILFMIILLFILCSIKTKNCTKIKNQYKPIPITKEEEKSIAEYEREGSWNDSGEDDPSTCEGDKESTQRTKPSSTVLRKLDLFQEKTCRSTRLQTPHLTEYTMNIVRERSPILQYGHASGYDPQANYYDDT